MKHKLNVFSDKKLNYFLDQLLYEYDLIFSNLKKVNQQSIKNGINIFIISSQKDLTLLDFKNLKNNYLILLNQRISFDLNKNINFLKTPISIKNLKNTIENLIENLNIHFHDILISKEKLTNVRNNSFCYLTRVEVEILNYLIKEKGTSKRFIKEKILNIKYGIETNSLESHLTRIRKKFNKVNTSLKIQSKNEKLIIIS